MTDDFVNTVLSVGLVGGVLFLVAELFITTHDEHEAEAACVAKGGIPYQARTTVKTYGPIMCLRKDAVIQQ